MSSDETRIPIHYDLSQLRGKQLSAALDSCCVMERLADQSGQQHLSGWWHSLVELLLTLALAEQVENGSSLALAKFHRGLKAAS